MATSLSDGGAPPALEPSDGWLSVEGRRLYWRRTGDPGWPAVILLHHGLGSVRAWKHQMPALARAGWQCLAYDRWGYGGSDPRPALDLPAFETDQRHLLALLDEFGLSQAVLVGHSDGGTLALHLAARQPQRVSRLVVVAAHIYVRPSMLPGMDSVIRDYAEDAGFRDKLVRAHGDKAGAVFDNWCRGWRRPEHLAWDMRPELGRIRCPTLVVQGTLDEHAPAGHARDLAAAVAASELWLIPGVGHMPPQEVPGLFNHKLLEFLEPARARTAESGQPPPGQRGC